MVLLLPATPKALRLGAARGKAGVQWREPAPLLPVQEVYPQIAQISADKKPKNFCS
jgi:hypothetical protein